MKIFVGMSGGVDSSLTAALLVEQGHDVTGVYMKNWSKDLPGMVCPWKDDYRDAKRVAVQLGIPFKLYDFESEYRQRVVEYLLDGYRHGITPNPDIMCNQEVKFSLFLETAILDGADMIATGHYASIRSKSEANGYPFSLHMAADRTKDQTYFLYRITEKALGVVQMPIGVYADKSQVRAEAEKRGLATAQKKDSQGICFVGKVGIKDFLLHELGEQPPGDIIDQRGARIGEHDGALFYTIGQRQGLGVGGGLPYYVTGKDMDKNEVYVTTDIQDQALWSDVIGLSELHWINEPPRDGVTYAVRTRHRAALISANFTGDASNNRGELHLGSPERAISPGQSVVLYEGDRVIGGGIVTRRHR